MLDTSGSRSYTCHTPTGSSVGAACQFGGLLVAVTGAGFEPDRQTKSADPTHLAPAVAFTRQDLCTDPATRLLVPVSASLSHRSLVVPQASTGLLAPAALLPISRRSLTADH